MLIWILFYVSINYIDRFYRSVLVSRSYHGTLENC